MAKYSDEEWELRCDLAAAYRLLAMYGMDDLVFTHQSVRIPGGQHRFLLNPFGLMFDEITASNLVTVDPEGRVITGEEVSGVNAAGFTIHSAIHMTRPDAVCVMHTHTTANMAVAAQAEGLLPLNQMSMEFYNRLSYHDYEGIALDLDERDRLVRDLGDNNVMVLRNHGLLTVGRSVGEAFYYTYYFEQAARLQIAAMTGGAKLVTPPDKVAEHTAQQFNRTSSNSAGKGSRPWAALRRRLDRECPDYKT